MNDVFDAFQCLICTDVPAYYTFCRNLKQQQLVLTGKDLVRSHSIMRLCLALAQFRESQRGATDVTVLLRQVIRSYERRLTLPGTLWQNLSKNAEAIGLRVVDTQDDDMVQLTADAWQPTWLADTEQIDHLQLRRDDMPVVGDGLLFAMTNGTLSTYQSLAQQVAVQSCLFASPGSTLLVTLPTGAGKSLCMLLPAWQASEGGRTKGGTTIVVVPTIALALDQEQRAREYFAHAPAPTYMPYCWTSSTPPETRAIICQGILEGTLPIVYVSPEALMHSQLRSSCLEAAQQGMLNWLVIDEAHLIETWGAGFRTDFQFLSAYRKQLLGHSQGQLRTLLLSATVSHACTTLLQQLFSDEGHFTLIQANRLRPEPAYWFKFSQSPSTREKRVIEALHYLPRPAILYVSRLDDARQWYKTLRQHCFRRIACFTGETDGMSRQRIVQDWSNNALDIIVATSAFGVGIDKSDIRTIIHACLPENIDRFYQEVGRSGRDGYSAISLVCATVADRGTALKMTRSARITYEKALQRWQSMRKTGLFSKEHGDIQLVDTNAPPADRPDMRRGPSNREWNEHTLLLMQRAGFLSIMDGQEEEFLEASGNVENAAWLQIRLLKPTITAYPESASFHAAFEHVRDDELTHIQVALSRIEHLVRAYDAETFAAHRCIAHEFAQMYSGCERACGGCAYCRQQGNKPYVRPLPLEVENTDITPVQPSQRFLSGDMRWLMGWQSVLNLRWEHSKSATARAQLAQCLGGFVGVGLQQVLLPDELLEDHAWLQVLIKELAHYNAMPHLVQAIDMLHKPDIPLYPLPTVIVYPTDDRVADATHRLLSARFRSWTGEHIPLVHVITPTLYLESEHGMFLERINGISLSVADMDRRLQNWQAF